MRVLILGGTTEAAALAAQAVDRFGDRVDVVTSLAGRLNPPRSLAGQVRIGGFGGTDGLARYLQSEAVRLVIDATHPFAAQISVHAAEACQRAGVPRLMLVRPPWRASLADQWVEVETMAAAAAYVSDHARRVFLATGPGAMKWFAENTSGWFLVRAFQQPDGPSPSIHAKSSCRGLLSRCPANASCLKTITSIRWSPRTPAGQPKRN